MKSSDKLNEKIIEEIKDLAEEIEIKINEIIELKCSDNIYEYKFKDILKIDKYIKKCKECNNLFVPRVSNKTQQYCSVKCRHSADIKYVGEMDLKRAYLLRSTLYTRKNRAKKQLNKDYDYDSALIQIKKINFAIKNYKAKKISETEFLDIINELEHEIIY